MPVEEQKTYEKVSRICCELLELSPSGSPACQKTSSREVQEKQKEFDAAAKELFDLRGLPVTLGSESFLLAEGCRKLLLLTIKAEGSAGCVVQLSLAGGQCDESKE